MLFEDLKNSGIIDSSNFNDIKAKLDVKGKVLHVNVIFNNVISLKSYGDLLGFIFNYLKKLSVDVDIDLEYKNE